MMMGTKWVNTQALKDLLILLEDYSLIDSVYEYLSEKMGHPLNQIDSQLWTLSEKDRNEEGEVKRHWIFYFFVGLGVPQDDVYTLMEASRSDIITLLQEVLAEENAEPMQLALNILDEEVYVNPKSISENLLDWAGGAYARHQGYLESR
jgi:hypothetical protein